MGFIYPFDMHVLFEIYRKYCQFSFLRFRFWEKLACIAFVRKCITKTGHPHLLLQIMTYYPTFLQQHVTHSIFTAKCHP